MSVKVKVEDPTIQKGSIAEKLMLQFFENAKNEFEEERSNLEPKFEMLKRWRRPEVEFNLEEWQPEYLLAKQKLKILVDEPIQLAINRRFESGFLTDEEKVYSHFKSPEERTSDMSRNTAGVIKVKFFPELYATALYLILHRKNSVCPISHTDRSKDKNLDIGYCDLLDIEGNTKLYVLWLENVRDTGKEFDEFHLHCLPASRYYKPDREFLV